MTVKPVIHGRDHLPDGADPIPGLRYQSSGALTSAFGPSGSSILPTNGTAIFSFPMDGERLAHGAIGVWVPIPLMAFSAGSFISSMGNPIVTNIDTTLHEYVLTHDYYFWKDDFSIYMHLSKSATSSGAGPADSIQVSHNSMTVVTNVGGDLTYSSPFWQVATTAGGTFGMAMKLNGSWS